MQNKGVPSTNMETLNKQDFPSMTIEQQLFLYSRAVDEASEGIQITNLMGNILYSNKAVESIYGWPPEYFVGKNVGEMNVDPQFAEQHIIPGIQQNGRWEGEVLVHHKDGSAFPILLSTALVSAETGIPFAMVGIIRDITVLKQQQKLAEDQLFYTGALQQIAETIIANSNTQVILENMIKIVGKTLAIDRTLIYDCQLEKNLALGLSEWDNSDEPGLRPSLKDWNIRDFKHSIQYLIKEKHGFQSHADEVNPLMIADGIDQLFHHQLGAKSITYYPFGFHENGFYLLIFHQTSHKRQWQQTELDFIDGVARQVHIATQKIRFLEERQKVEQEVWEEKERAQVTLQSIGDAVITTDLLGNVEYLNQVAVNLTGWKMEDALGKHLSTIFHIIKGDSDEPVESPVDKCLQEGRIVKLSTATRLVNRNGQMFHIEDSASPIRNRVGEIVGAVLVFHDVSDKRKLIEQMIYQVYHDPLTGLANRMLFQDRLSVAIVQAQRNREMLAVLFLDLDRFKQVNDMLGHDRGDELLQKVATDILVCLRQSDTVARVGGDEFTVLLPRIGQEDEAAKVAQKIVQTLDHPWIIAGQEFHVTGSIGIAVFPDDGEDSETLLKHADTAMYRAKEQGKNKYQLFAPSMNLKIMERLQLENALRQALKNHEFLVLYQPLVNSVTSRIIGVEALIRWAHPTKGLVSPADFIPLAEETGLIVPIGEWVLESACAQNKAWQELGLPPIRVTVNLSACQFSQKNLVDTVARVLEQSGLDPQLLELEITESALIGDMQEAATTLSRLKEMGVRIAIDDFGTGYSSLNYLKRFPPNTLKIDRSFVKDVTSNPEDAAIVAVIIDVARTLNLNVIAEGVETTQQLTFLRDRHCVEMQGFLFSKPIEPEEITRLLQANTLWPAGKQS